MGKGLEEDENYKLFSKDDKAKAFDEIAKKFYLSNFGSTAKSDIETLMFSIYIERILDENVKNPNTYSDYTLSKSLGISQEKINRLKIQKELKYPRKKFNWKKAFLAGLDNAYIEKGKIKVFIDDPNIAIEVKHAIEINGGFTDSSFNSKICIICPGDFLDLLCVVGEEKDINKTKKSIMEKLKKDFASVDFITEEPFGKQMKKLGLDFTVNALGNVLQTIPVVGGAASGTFKNFINVLGKNISVNNTRKKIRKTIGEK